MDLPPFWSALDLGSVVSQSCLELVLLFCRQLGEIEQYVSFTIATQEGLILSFPSSRNFALRGVTCGRLT